MKKPTSAQPSNYEIMRDRMELEFAQHDQQEMIRKFSLRQDADFLYIPMLGRDYRIHRDTGRVERCTEGGYVHADYNESMILFDMLAWSRPDCRLAGQFVPLDGLKGVVRSASPAAGVFARLADPFGGRTELLARACLALGGTPGTVGDVASTLPLFTFFPVVLQFWDGDEDFGPVLKFMWDQNATDFMHYETICFAVSHIARRLRETMAELEASDRAI